MFLIVQTVNDISDDGLCAVINLYNIKFDKYNEPTDELSIINLIYLR